MYNSCILLHTSGGGSSGVGGGCEQKPYHRIRVEFQLPDIVTPEGKLFFVCSYNVHVHTCILALNPQGSMYIAWDAEYKISSM